MSPKDDANAKPPDYDQSVGWPYQTPQHNSRMQYNMQQFNPGIYQQSFPMDSSQNVFMMPNINQMQHMGTNSVPDREQTENEKKERMRKQLRKRKIPEDI